MGISETDIRLHLVARDSDNHDLRVHTNGYLVTSSPSNVAIATEVSGIVPSGDVFALRFTGTGDVVLHVTTLNDDAPVTVDVPLHLTR